MVTDPRMLLAQITAQVEAATKALDDEREGDLHRAVMLLAADADQLAEVVTRW
jgi:hypothetical protein